METVRPVDLALEHPGGADATTMLRLGGFALVTLLLGALALLYGRTPVEIHPQFFGFYSGFYFLASSVTAVLLFGQFAYRHHQIYVILAAAYLFGALGALAVLWASPGALRPESAVPGGAQGAIWIWHIWHGLFPLIVTWALSRGGKHAVHVTSEQVAGSIVWTVLLTIVLTVLLFASVVHFEHLLPPLRTINRPPLPVDFYVAGGVAALLTVVAILLALVKALQRSILHVWLVAMLIAFLVDITFNLGAYPAYTVGWYFGKFVSMLGSLILFFVMFSHVNGLYAWVTSVTRDLVDANEQLGKLVKEKGTLQTELHDSQIHLRTLAFHDPVTGLPNRLSLSERLKHALDHGIRYRHATAVLLMDLDHFEEIIERYGQAVADALLKAIGQRLAPFIRAEDTLARIGNDVFVIVVPEVAQHKDAISVASKVLELINPPFEFKGRSIRISASIGIAIREVSDELTATKLLHRAELAMHSAKKGGGNRFSLAAIED